MARMNHKNTNIINTKDDVRGDTLGSTHHTSLAAAISNKNKKQVPLRAAIKVIRKKRNKLCGFG